MSLLVESFTSQVNVAGKKVRPASGSIFVTVKEYLDLPPGQQSSVLGGKSCSGFSRGTRAPAVLLGVQNGIATPFLEAAAASRRLFSKDPHSGALASPPCFLPNLEMD